MLVNCHSTDIVFARLADGEWVANIEKAPHSMPSKWQTEWTNCLKLEAICDKFNEISVSVREESTSAKAVFKTPVFWLKLEISQS